MYDVKKLRSGDQDPSARNVMKNRTDYMDCEER